MKIHAIALLILAAGWLSACGGLLESGQPARQTYLLAPLEGTDSENQNAQTIMLDLTAVPGLDSDRVQALAGDAALRPYANARWADNLPEVLASVTQRSLQQAGYGPVRLGALAGPGDWQIRLQVQQFYGRLGADGQTSVVQVELSGWIGCAGEQHSVMLGSRPSVASHHLSSVVAAHQKGLDTVSKELIQALQNSCG